MSSPLSPNSGAQAPPVVKDVEGAKHYLSRNSVHMLFETLATNVINDQPDDPVLYCYNTLEGMLSPEAQEEAKQRKATSDDTVEGGNGSVTSDGGVFGKEILPLVLFVLPSTGDALNIDVKGDITDRLASEKDAVVTTTMGDLLRAEAARGGSTGDQVQKLLTEESEQIQFDPSSGASPLGEASSSINFQGAQAVNQTTGTDRISAALCLEVLNPWLQQQPRTTFEGQQVTVVIHDFPRNISDAVAIQKLVTGASCFSTKPGTKNTFADVKGVVSFSSSVSAVTTALGHIGPLLDYFKAWDAHALTTINISPQGKEKQKVATGRAYGELCKLLGIEPGPQPEATEEAGQEPPGAFRDEEASAEEEKTDAHSQEGEGAKPEEEGDPDSSAPGQESAGGGEETKE